MHVGIEYLRLLFSMLIVFFHANSFWKGTVFKGGYFGVEFFFILICYLFVKHIDKYSNCNFNTLASETIEYLKSKIKGFFFLLLFHLYLQVL